MTFHVRGKIQSADVFWVFFCSAVQCFAAYPIGKLSLSDVIKARMEEMNITQRTLAEMLEISPPRVSEYLNGKSDPTLQVARRIQKQLNIDASVILGAK